MRVPGEADGVTEVRGDLRASPLLRLHGGSLQPRSRFDFGGNPKQEEEPGPGCLWGTSTTKEIIY